MRPRPRREATPSASTRSKTKTDSLARPGATPAARLVSSRFPVIMDIITPGSIATGGPVTAFTTSTGAVNGHVHEPKIPYAKKTKT